MSYAVKELFYTLQGEGLNTGRPAVFCRFAGCNLWSGLENDRAASVCRFCDTDFVGIAGEGGGRFPDADALVGAIRATWPASAAARTRPFTVLTGGEPLLQVDEELIRALHAAGFEVAIETNGTILPPPGVDWVCVSPKAGCDLKLRHGDELKLVFPQADASPERYADLEFRHFLLQPMDGPDRQQNTQLALEYCLGHPQWRLNLQTHKWLGIP
jgi:7-carboxy-7-deazaguanine synthase